LENRINLKVNLKLRLIAFGGKAYRLKKEKEKLKLEI